MATNGSETGFILHKTLENPKLYYVIIFHTPSVLVPLS